MVGEWCLLTKNMTIIEFASVDTCFESRGFWNPRRQEYLPIVF